jgi:hypothetical protein
MDNDQANVPGNVNERTMSHSVDHRSPRAGKVAVLSAIALAAVAFSPARAFSGPIYLQRGVAPREAFHALFDLPSGRIPEGGFQYANATALTNPAAFGFSNNQPGADGMPWPTGLPASGSPPEEAAWSAYADMTFYAKSGAQRQAFFEATGIKDEFNDVARIWFPNARGYVITYPPEAAIPQPYVGNVSGYVVHLNSDARAWGITPAPLRVDPELGPIYAPEDMSVLGPAHPVSIAIARRAAAARAAAGGGGPPPGPLAEEVLEGALVARSAAGGIPRGFLGSGWGGPMCVAVDIVMGEDDPGRLGVDFLVGMAADTPFLGPPIMAFGAARTIDQIVGGTIMSEPARLLVAPPAWVRKPWPEIQREVENCNSRRLGSIAATGAACAPPPPRAPQLPSPNDGIAD